MNDKGLEVLLRALDNAVELEKMEDKKRCCDNCVWQIPVDGKWICSNEDTEEYGEETADTHICDGYYAI